MSMAPRSTLRRILDGFDLFRTIVVNLIFVLILLVVFVAFFSGGPPSIANGSALVLDLEGNLVEELTPVDPIEGFLGGATLFEVRLRDVVDVVNAATHDDRIKMLVLRLDNLVAGDTAKLAIVGDAIKNFRAAGKSVIASGDAYSQEQYFLASYADEVYLNPMGQLLLTGYNFQSVFMREALEKLSVNVHVFRVGEFKAAVEPFLRDDMSEEARIANRAVLEDLWSHYTNIVAANREIDPAQIDGYLQNIATLVTNAQGDLARIALEQGFVDELLTRDALLARLKEDVSDGNGDLLQVGFGQYLAEVRLQQLPFSTQPQVAVVTARGTIVVDDREGGSAGGNQIAELIRAAREDDQIKALVLRVDSPGGSAFGSELIRNELELTQQVGKPVVTSMSGLAASGGYWIAATSDEIWADPSTITGSIGIFGVVPTVEKSLERIGVRVDGVSNSQFGEGLSPIGGINETVSAVFQQNIENGYRQFIQLVVRGRDIPLERVQQIAEGRIWSGADAKELGLVDGLGNIEGAIAAAARLAQLSEDQYEVRYLEQGLSAQQMLLRQLMDQFGAVRTSPSAAAITGVIDAVHSQIKVLTSLDDPRGMYALCTLCNGLH